MGHLKTLSVFFAGAAIGAAAGILLAPHKGSKTRKKICKAGEDLMGTAKEKAGEFGDMIKDGLSSVKKKVAQE